MWSYGLQPTYFDKYNTVQEAMYVMQQKILQTEHMNWSKLYTLQYNETNDSNFCTNAMFYPIQYDEHPPLMFSLWLQLLASFHSLCILLFMWTLYASWDNKTNKNVHTHTHDLWLQKKINVCQFNLFFLFWTLKNSSFQCWICVLISRNIKWNSVCMLACAF